MNTITDSKLFAAFVQSDFNLKSLAATLTQPFEDLLDWATSPAVIERLSALRKFTDNVLALRAYAASDTSLSGLVKVLDTTDSLTETRQAATTVLRFTTALNKPAPKPPKSPTTEPTFQPDPLNPSAPTPPPTDGLSFGHWEPLSPMPNQPDPLPSKMSKAQSLHSSAGLNPMMPMSPEST